MNRSKWKTLIIDDEAPARSRLSDLLSAFSENFEIIGYASNGDEAEAEIEEKKPDLVFLDIEMPGKNIFKVLADLRHKPLVVFCTAYDRYAIQAFSTYSVEYLIKPADESNIKKLVDKLEGFSQRINSYQTTSFMDLVQNFQEKKVPNSIPHKVGDKTILVKLNTVTYFETNNRYVDFFDVQGTKYMTDICLKKLEEKLPSNFIRISKSSIINTDQVKETHKYFKGRMVFVMDDVSKTRIISGKNYTDRVKRIFEF